MIWQLAHVWKVMLCCRMRFCECYHRESPQQSTRQFHIRVRPTSTCSNELPAQLKNGAPRSLPSTAYISLPFWSPQTVTSFFLDPTSFLFNSLHLLCPLMGYTRWDLTIHPPSEPNVLTRNIARCLTFIPFVTAQVHF